MGVMSLTPTRLLRALRGYPRGQEGQGGLAGHGHFCSQDGEQQFEPTPKPW